MSVKSTLRFSALHVQVEYSWRYGDILTRKPVCTLNVTLSSLTIQANKRVFKYLLPHQEYWFVDEVQIKTHTLKNGLFWCLISNFKDAPAPLFNLYMCIYFM